MGAGQEFLVIESNLQSQSDSHLITSLSHSLVKIASTTGGLSQNRSILLFFLKEQNLTTGIDLNLEVSGHTAN
jgi:hypothetical protein